MIDDLVLWLRAWPWSPPWTPTRFGDVVRRMVINRTPAPCLIAIPWESETYGFRMVLRSKGRHPSVVDQRIWTSGR